MKYTFRKAEIADLPATWDILQQAIIRRREDGSDQWQDGYPNPTIIQQDIEGGIGHVLAEDDIIVGYVVIMVNDEPAYAEIEGRWLTDSDFVVIHRVAISGSRVGEGLAKKILGFVEDYAINKNIQSIRGDTNFDNIAMIKTFEKSGYIYCGEVYMRGKIRRAYEKVLSKE